ncbi:MAG: hypothetical protein CM15mP89_5140 [Gammaproteobacteria bacterium]|nr:MAG: hypothetical protein CM15mP89_5140 [Gammaproteobacteria bacterium]
MGKFDLYVGRSVLLATLGVLLLLVGLDALTSIVDETDDMRDGYSFLDILIYVGYTLPRRVHEFVPFAALIGALIGLGRLAASSELVVIRAAGVSMFSMATMVLKPALLMAAVGFAVGEFRCTPYRAVGDESPGFGATLRVSRSGAVWCLEPGRQYVCAR